MVEVIVATAADVAGKGLEEGVCTPNRPSLAASSLVVLSRNNLGRLLSLPP